MSGSEPTQEATPAASGAARLPAEAPDFCAGGRLPFPNEPKSTPQVCSPWLLESPITGSIRQFPLENLTNRKILRFVHLNKFAILSPRSPYENLVQTRVGAGSSPRLGNKLLLLPKHGSQDDAAGGAPNVQCAFGIDVRMALLTTRVVVPIFSTPLARGPLSGHPGRHIRA